MANSTLLSYTMQDEDFETTNFYMGYTRMAFYKQGNIVVCQYHIYSVRFGNTVDHTVFQVDKIPTPFRPNRIIRQNVISYEGSIRNGLLIIKPDGSMYVRMGREYTNMNAYGSITYIVED